MQAASTATPLHPLIQGAAVEKAEGGTLMGTGPATQRTLLPPAVKAALCTGMSSRNQLATWGFLPRGKGRGGEGGERGRGEVGPGPRCATCPPRHSLCSPECCSRLSGLWLGGSRLPTSVSRLSFSYDIENKSETLVYTIDKDDTLRPTHLTPSTENRRTRRSSPALSSRSPPTCQSTLLGEADERQRQRVRRGTRDSRHSAHRQPQQRRRLQRRRGGIDSGTRRGVTARV